MINLIFFLTLSFISITIYCSQNEIDDWVDAESEFLDIQTEFRNTFIQAHSIMTNLRYLSKNLSTKETELSDFKKALPVASSHIEELYKLSCLPEIQREEYNASINRPNNFEQNNNLLIISNSIIVGEILLTNIFRKAQELGLYPEGYPANL